MSTPVLDHKISNLMEDITSNLEIGTERSFAYKDETWTFTVVGINEFNEPLFTIDIEERGEWHESV